MRIVIAEDLALLRDGLTRLLADAGHDVVATVETGPDLVEALAREMPDVAIVDVRLPPDFSDEGLRAALEARAARPGLPVLVLSQYVERTYATQLLHDEDGAFGYLLKDRIADVDSFLESLERVAAGGTAVDREVVAELVLDRGGDEGLRSLTPRERGVLTLIAEGRSNAAIARRLDVSEGAVEKHVTSIFGKLDLPAAQGDHRRVLAVLRFLGSR